MTIGLFRAGVMGVVLGIIIAIVSEPVGMVLIQTGLLLIGARLVWPLIIAVFYEPVPLFPSDFRRHRTSGSQDHQEQLDMDTGSIEDYRR